MNSNSLKRLTIIYLLFIGGGILATGLFAYLIVNFSFETYSFQLTEKLYEPHVSLEITRLSNEIIEARLDEVRNIIFILSAVAAVVSPFVAFLFAKRRLSAILATEERQKQFISNASHELRTPLAVLFGELELALKKERTVEEYKDTLQHSKAEADRLINLTNQLLLLSRLDEKTILPKQSVDIKSVLKEAVQKNASLQKKKHLKIDVHFASKTLLVKADSELLLIMFSNLIDNAAKYSPPQETIELWVEDHSSFARVTISNTGVTLSEQEVRTIFKRFNRAKSPKDEGFGLGLAIAKTIADAHKGRIRLLIDKHTTKVEVDLPYPKIMGLTGSVPPR